MNDQLGDSIEGGGITKNLSRRTFVKIGVLAGTGLTLGVSYRVIKGPGDPPTDAAFAPSAFLRIDVDGSITVMVAKSEMGQGVATALPQLVAEELHVPLSQVSFEFAPAHPAYGTAMGGMQLTGGSTSIRDSWWPLREAGAKARWMLREAAAQRWKIAPDKVQMYEGKAVHPDGSKLTYAQLASAAALMDVPKDVPLRDPADFQVIGMPAPRLDVPAKTTGEAIFGMDAGPTGTRVALVARSPVFGGVLRAFDSTAALSVNGVDEVVELESGIAVIADGYVAAQEGRGLLTVEWEDDGEWSTLDDAEIVDRLQEAANQDGATVREEGDIDSVLSLDGEQIRAAYTLPYLAHATMEPMNCTAWVRNGQCTVWAPTQFQNGPGLVGGGARQVAAKAAGVSPDNTVVHTTFLGGGFGRRAEQDFVREAAELAGKVDGPVKVIWAREDDIQHDFYRPASYHECSAILGVDGMPEAWRHRIASQSILQRMVPSWVPDFATNWAGSSDPTSTEGAQDQPYHIPNILVTYSKVDLPVPVGFWRSVGHTQNAFVVESFIDELAHVAGQDPYEYRRELLEEHPRHRAVLDVVAKASEWASPVPGGRARGIAVAESFGSFVAEVAEVSIENGQLRVHKVWCAIDCGMVVNPAIVRAQMESGIVYGLTAAFYGRINIQGGRVVQSNFHDYQMLRMRDAPDVEVILIPSQEAPGGVGEPGTPPIAPAVTNALFSLTGQRIRELPIQIA